MVTVVDQLKLNDVVENPLGEPQTAYLVQTFVAGGSSLDAIEFLIDTYAGPDDTEYRVLIVEADLSSGHFIAGDLLFESATLVDPYDPEDSYALVHLDTGGVALTKGKSYGFILDAFVTRDGQNSLAHIGAVLGPTAGADYPDGALSYLSPSGDTRTEHLNTDWEPVPGYEMAFRAYFSNPGGAVIKGTNHRDVIDATQTVVKQSLPTVNDDTIFGLRGRDKLSGLDGDDTLDGGKGRDQLFGGDGWDLFVFTTGFRQPPDKIMDFVSADDTIVLAGTKFKALAPGVLTDAAFHDIGEAASAADRIIYTASGKLQYDKDGPGGADPVTIAKLVGVPELSANDILVA